jgi:hypothetical protein
LRLFGFVLEPNRQSKDQRLADYRIRTAFAHKIKAKRMLLKVPKRRAKRLGVVDQSIGIAGLF